MGDVPQVMDVAKVSMRVFEKLPHVHDVETGLCVKDRAGTCTSRKPVAR